MRWNAGQHSYRWSAECQLEPAPSTLVMGVLNVTPDSFSDGGRFVNVDQAVEQALAMIRAGADIIDVGGESTRPGSQPVSKDEELARVLPVIQGIRARSPVHLSIDTTKSAVAAAALTAGADTINDVSAMTHDPDMVALAASCEAGVILMHMRGTPKNMQTGDLSDPDIVHTVCTFLEERISDLVSAGVDFERITLDPGIGFGKTVDQNLHLVHHIRTLADLGRPVLLGISRKSVLGALTGRSVDFRLAATCAAHVVGLQQGAQILRVHDVAEARDVIAVTQAFRTLNGGLNAG